MIREILPTDAPAICDIYNHYIAKTTITFEEDPVAVTEMADRIVSSNSLPWIVYEEESKVIGYALASEWKSRCAYKHSSESSVYLHPDYTGKGIGSKLYKDLMDRLVEMQVHAIIGGIALPNEASIRLHEKLGFEKVAQFKQVGHKFGKWIDVGYWQLINN